MFLVSEIFESIQGEGRYLGRPSTFLRLAHCNLACLWCDSAYTWRFSEKQSHRDTRVYDKETEIKEYSEAQVLFELRGYKPSHIVVTGGEPMLQARKVESLMTELSVDLSRSWSVEIETAGTLPPFEEPILDVNYTVSPKLASSGNTLHQRRRMDVLELYRREHSVFKFVVCDMLDLAEIDELVRRLELSPDRVFLMPEGIDEERITKGLRFIVPLAIERGYRVTTRLQIYAFGNKRGT